MSAEHTQAAETQAPQGSEGSEDGTSAGGSGDNFDRSHPAFKAVAAQTLAERKRADAAEKRLAALERSAAEAEQQRAAADAASRGDYEGALAKEREAYAARMAELEQKLSGEREARAREAVIGRLNLHGVVSEKAADFLAADYLRQPDDERGDPAEYVAQVVADESNKHFFRAAESNEPARAIVPGDRSGAAHRGSGGMDINAAASDPNVDVRTVWQMAARNLGAALKR